MNDFLLQLGQSPTARKVVRRLGLPLPLPERLRRAQGPWEKRPLADRGVVVGSAPAGGEDRLMPAVADALAAAGADPYPCAEEQAAVFRDAGEAFGRPSRLAGETTPLRAHALVFNATGIGDPEGLRAVYDFFHAWVGRLERCGRALVLARPPEGLPAPAAAAQRGLEGFVRSLGREIGRAGATANLLYVAEGAEGRVPPVLTFLLSDRSAFISGQPLRVTGVARGPARVAWAPRSLEGKVALVTGAARGIGAEIARLLAGEGARVACLDRPQDDAPLSQLAREVGGHAILLDVTDTAAPERLAAELARHGGVDIVVHNAGITRDKTLVKMSPEQWDSAIAVNLAAVVRLTEALAAGPLRDGGRLIALSSIAGIAGNVGQTNYAASKAGLLGWMQAQSAALGPRGITVNALAPGFIETRLTAAIPFAIREVARRMSSLAQGGLPRDVAEAATFLASPVAVGLSGNVVRVCGQALAGA